MPTAIMLSKTTETAAVQTQSTTAESFMRFFFILVNVFLAFVAHEVFFCLLARI